MINRVRREVIAVVCPLKNCGQNKHAAKDIIVTFKELRSVG